MIENKERVICQGFHVLWFKERLSELKLTFGFYEFAKLKDLEDEVIMLEGYTSSMGKILDELEEGVVAATQCMKGTWKMDPNMPSLISVGVDKGNKQDFSTMEIRSTIGDLTISTQISADMIKNFRGKLENMIEEIHAIELLRESVFFVNNI